MNYSKEQVLDLIAVALTAHESAFSVQDQKNCTPYAFKKNREKAEVFLERVTSNEGKLYWSDGINN